MSTAQKRILIIEDDLDAANVLEAYLLRDNFAVAIAANGVRGLDMVREWKPDLILLDVMLPGMNGIDLLANLRKHSEVPVIMVTAMGEQSDKIGALRFGADDYVVKPYHPGEVVARVYAVLRRAGKQEKTHSSLLRHGQLVVDLQAMTASVQVNAESVVTLDLTPTEFSLLACFLSAPTKAFSRQELLESCLPDSDALERVVDTHVYNLRKKLEQQGIQNVLITVRAIGYRFKP